LAQDLKPSIETIKMNKMKFVALILIAVAFTQCKSVKFDKHPPFKVTDAAFSNWVGGLPGVSGIKVIIAYKTDTDVAFDSIFFANRKTKVELQKMNDKLYLIGHFDTSTVTNKEDLILHRNSNKELQNKVPNVNKLPFKLKENEAVISFKEGDKTKYVKVKKIKQTKSDFYQ